MKGREFDKAWDGRLLSFYDGPEDGTTGADFGSAHKIAVIEYYPRSEWEGRMVGGAFEGANESERGPWTTLHVIDREPKPSEWTRVKVHTAGDYQWVRYSANKTSFRPGGYGNVAEIRVLALRMPHPCDDGSHDCDKGEICYAVIGTSPARWKCV